MLDGLRILDLSHLLPGQYATALLAQLGAEVTLIEQPDATGHVRQFRTSFAAYNHSKQSVSLDLKRDEGREAFLSLVTEADAIVQQFRPGVVERLGVDYNTVQEVNPEVVYCSISGYGSDGPRADHAGHDLNYVGVAGALDVAPTDDGVPFHLPIPVADVATSMFAALSIAAALHSEGGEHIDLSMTDVAVNAMLPNLAEMFGRGHPVGWGDTPLLGGYPAYATYECADGRPLTVGCVEPHFWERLCEYLDLSEYADEQWPRKDERRREQFAAFRARFRELPREEWLEYLDPAEVPVAPANDLAEVPDDKQLTHRKVFREVNTPHGDPSQVVTYPARFHSHNVAPNDPPAQGEHTRECLRATGYDDSEIDSLAKEGIIGLE